MAPGSVPISLCGKTMPISMRYILEISLQPTTGAREPLVEWHLQRPHSPPAMDSIGGRVPPAIIVVVGSSSQESSRADAFASWVRRWLGAEARFVALPVEASTRRFLRVFADGTTCVAMDSPPETENNGQFVRLSRTFVGAGLPVPVVLHEDMQRGFFLVSDVGEGDLAAAYANDTAAPLEAAIEALVQLQRVASDDIPPYTLQRFDDELGIFAEWFVGKLLGATPDATFLDAKRLLLDAIQAMPTCVVHRDFHCRNLLWNDGRLGIVDFQDALVGPVTYDIASLLRDCYHVFDEDEVGRWRRHFLMRSRLDIDEATFARAFDFTAIQRQLKAIGIFVRLRYRLGRGSHLADVMPVLRRVIALSRNYDELLPLADWLEGMAPAAEPKLRALSQA